MAEPYPCVAPGCNRKFEKAHGAQVHFSRVHKDLGKWDTDWQALLNDREKLPTFPGTQEPRDELREPKREVVKRKRVRSSVSSRRFMEGMIDALRRSPTLQLTTAEIMDDLRQNGVTDSRNDDSVRTRISTAAREGGGDIQRIGYGVYGLKKDANRLFPNPTEEVFDPSAAASEILSLRRLNEKKAEAIMGLTRILVALATD